MKFMLGVNYWDSRSGTDMWRQFDPEVIRADVRSLADCGVRQMRVFPNWRDFQPVEEYLGGTASPAASAITANARLQMRTALTKR